jgi:branched-chain amino acid transport system permease protein
MIGFLQNLLDALSLGSLYALAALGIELLVGILRLVNFAHGDFITLGAYALIVPSSADIATLLIGGWTWAALVPAVVVIVVVIALLSDVLIFRPLRTTSAPTLMTASFALSFIIQNGILMIDGARPKAINLWSGLSDQVQIGPLTRPKLDLVVLGVTILMMLLLTFFLKRARYGV